MELCLNLLTQIYDSESKWKSLWDTWFPIWQKKAASISHDTRDIRNQELAVLITYGDSLYYPQKNAPPPLTALYTFLDEMCDNVITGVHILPYFEYSSDDGFSISDYRTVRHDLGTWNDIDHIAAEYYLMTDLVLNHCSSKHKWFKKFLNNEPPFTDYFITVPPDTNVSAVVRPRPHFLLNEFDTAEGKKHVWTTFSRDQVDLNFANPEVLFEMLDTMLEYCIDHSTRLLRLDAIAYLWKELGTPCIHHPKTHLVVKLMRALLDALVPHTTIVTETNVPHEENISYFGNNDEAHMIYQFPLPPLILHSIIAEDTTHLQQWASHIPPPTPYTTYFNFCASHDGIGITPVHGILTEKEIAHMVDSVKKRGGLISYKATPQGELPYELNINYLSAVAPYELPTEERAHIFLASQSIMLSMPGIPGIYIHSLLGSENWNHGVKETGHNRTINRQQLEYMMTVDEIHTQGSLRNLVFNGYLTLLLARIKSTAFHPSAPATILDTDKGLFGIIRSSVQEEHQEQVLCLVNISSQEITQTFPIDVLPWFEGGEDLINGDLIFLSQERHKNGTQHIIITMEPYEIIWLRYGRSTNTISETL